MNKAITFELFGYGVSLVWWKHQKDRNRLKHIIHMMVGTNGVHGFSVGPFEFLAISP